jgi:hypothetical protein
MLWAHDNTQHTTSFYKGQGEGCRQGGQQWAWAYNFQPVEIRGAVAKW